MGAPNAATAAKTRAWPAARRMSIRTVTPSAYHRAARSARPLRDFGGISPGRWGNAPDIDARIFTLFGFCGVAPMATRLSYLLSAIVKYVTTPSCAVAVHGK